MTTTLPDTPHSGPANQPLALGSSDGLGAVLAGHGVFKGAQGLAGLLDAQEFWDEQPYGTRLYYGPGAADYLHRGVLRAAVAALSGQAPNVKIDRLAAFGESVSNDGLGPL